MIITIVATTKTETEMKTEPKPFFDAERNYLFGRRFAALFSPECTSRIEFCDFFAEHLGSLNRHMDDENDDKVDGYQHGASSSFVVNNAGPEVQDGPMVGDVFRVNMVMCSRNRVGQWLNLYRQKDFENIFNAKCDGKAKSGGICLACPRSKKLFPDFNKYFKM